MTFLLRAALVCAIGLAELMVLQLRLDQRAILDSPRWWAQILWYYPALFQLGLVCLGSMAMLSRRDLAEMIRAARSQDSFSSALRFFAIHAALFAVFFWLSFAGFERGLAASSKAADLWFLAWTLCGLSALACWTFLLVRPSLWRAFLIASSRRLLWGAALGSALWLTATFVTGELFDFGRLPTLQAIAAVLRATGHEATYTMNPALIRIDGFAVSMSAGCFGYEGIALVLVFCTAYLVALRRALAFPRSFLLIAMAVAASWVMNVLRVTLLVLIGAYRGKYAVEGFHSVAGWIFFAAIAAGVVALSQRPWFAKNPAAARPTEGARENPAAPYLLPLLVLLATAMVTRIFTRDFDTLYPLRFIFVGAALLAYRRQISELGWRGSSWAAVPGALIFAGWMALALSCSIGGVLARLERPLTPAGSGWREWVIAISGREGCVRLFLLLS